MKRFAALALAATASLGLISGVAAKPAQAADLAQTLAITQLFNVNSASSLDCTTLSTGLNTLGMLNNKPTRYGLAQNINATATSLTNSLGMNLNSAVVNKLASDLSFRASACGLTRPTEFEKIATAAGSSQLLAYSDLIYNFAPQLAQ
ncbi:MAG: hypothetical protein Q3972_02580 [Corynebacterium sp.]|nr:hypothetical protein [Corynebacterium sp.]